MRRDLEFFSKQFPIDEIEKGLICAFLHQSGVRVNNNVLIKDFVGNAAPEMIRVVSDYFTARKVSLSLKVLERCFELLIEESERKLNGAFYTPSFIVDYICKRTIRRKLAVAKSPLKVCDPCCGSGAFLVEATKTLSKHLGRPMLDILENNIFGVDISERSVRRAKLILTLLAILNGEDVKHIRFNIRVGDSLDRDNFDWREVFCEVFSGCGGFDVVLGNPPYVRIQNLGLEVRKYLQEKWLTARTGNIDLYIPFFELGLEIINSGGIAGFITPNSYFSSKAGRVLRKLLKEGRYVTEIIDFDSSQIFEDATTYTAITFLDRGSNKDCFDYFRHQEPGLEIGVTESDFKKVGFDSLNDEKWILLGGHELEKVKLIESIGRPLGKLADISVGIATLADRLYILDGTMTEDGRYYLKNYKGAIFKVEKGITKEILKASTLKSEEDVQANKRRIIWPYSRINGKVVPIPETELAESYPQTYKYLLAIKVELQKRDRGKKHYPTWYCFGRSQGLEGSFGIKLLTSTLNKAPNFILCDKEDATFCAGYGIKSGVNLVVLKKILNSAVMDYYIQKTSRPYRDNYRSFAKSFIENFSIPEFKEQETCYLMEETNKQKLDEFLFKKYWGEQLPNSRITKVQQQELPLFKERRSRYLRKRTRKSRLPNPLAPR